MLWNDQIDDIFSGLDRDRQLVLNSESRITLVKLGVIGLLLGWHVEVCQLTQQVGRKLQRQANHGSILGPTHRWRRHPWRPTGTRSARHCPSRTWGHSTRHGRSRHCGRSHPGQLWHPRPFGWSRERHVTARVENQRHVQSTFRQTDRMKRPISIDRTRHGHQGVLHEEAEASGHDRLPRMGDRSLEGRRSRISDIELKTMLRI